VLLLLLLLLLMMMMMMMMWPAGLYAVLECGEAGGKGVGCLL
jgi:hypothetical protein